MAHTPGPWQINGPDRGTRHDGNRVLAITASHPKGGGQDIAECLEDNASLIAAAPDLLAALKRCVQWLSDLDNDISEKAELLNAIDAIAKAEGRAE